MQKHDDDFFMNEALKEAQKAFEKDEVPIGSVIVCKEKIIARGYNLTQTLTDATAHAEMQAITSASEFLGNKYLNECTLYVTLEPCTMCAGALFWSQIGKIVYGADDPKRGYRLLGENVLHPKTQVVKGILAKNCSTIIKNFFIKKRN